MQTIRPRTWQGYHREVGRIRNEYGQHTTTLDSGKVWTRKVQILFRGQQDSGWDLLTTLERKTQQKIDVLEYLRIATTRVNEIEAFTGEKWNTKPYPELVEEIRSTQDSLRVHLPSYDYLCYLRHHGFPSPLLDWTESPYIAAYFAYLGSRDNTDVAVYCYVETPEGHKGGRGGAPMITVQGPYVTTHRRHFSQKAWYTVATEWDYASERHFFCPHANVFRRNDTRQDLLFKIVLPARCRTEALTQLDDYNINHFTLFHSEDALVKTIGTRIFDIGV